MPLAWVGEFAAASQFNSGRIFNVNLVICTATSLESALLRERLQGTTGIRIIETGVGPVNAAHAVTLAIMQSRPDAIIVCGVGGAYAGSGLNLGDVASASVEVYGDLGANSPSGFLDMKALGFPVIAGARPLFNEMPMQLFPAERRLPFVTVSSCTGTTAAANELHRRTGGGVENMEGAAVAHIAHLHRVPVGEIRAISNMVTDRDPSKWRLEEAAAVAQESLLNWLASHPL
jgi:futalosine hydrolase